MKSKQILQRIETNCSSQGKTPLRSGSYDPLAALSDRDSTLLGNEYVSNRKETYLTLYKKLQPEGTKTGKKKISIAQFDTPKIQFPFQNRSPGYNLESPQVQLQSIELQTSEKKSDPVIRADLFGTYPEKDYRGSDFRSSNGFSGKSGSQPLTFQHRTQTQLGQTKHSINDDEARKKQGSMSWTGQYGHFLSQIDKMKRELETLGEENLELANLITDN